MSAFARSRTGNKRRRLGFAVAASLLTLAAVSTAQTATAAVAAPTKTPTQSTAHATRRRAPTARRARSREEFRVVSTSCPRALDCVLADREALHGGRDHREWEDSGKRCELARPARQRSGFPHRESGRGHPRLSEARIGGRQPCCEPAVRRGQSVQRQHRLQDQRVPT